MSWRRYFYIMFLLLVLFSPAMLWCGQLFLQHWTNSANETRIIEIPRGLGLMKTVELLAQVGVIDHPRLFLLASRITAEKIAVQAGEYRISPSMSYERILGDLTRGRVFLHTVVVPEGFTLDQILERLGEQRLLDPTEGQALAHDQQFIHSLGLKGSSLEGYLFPDTYQLARGLGARAIFAAMIARFQREWQGLGEKSLFVKAQARGLSREQVVILASIIERESKLPQERPLISAIFHNRLKLSMRLQADPTVGYGVEGFNGRLTREDLDTDHPYNTYTREGLPPGPICSPGRASLEAAIEPANVDYLYFVARGDGSHAFSRDYQEQINNVNRFQKRRIKLENS